MNDLLSKIIIRPIQASDNLDELTLLLHRSYKKLADEGFRFLATHQTVEITKQRITNSDCYVAVLDHKIIGTISYRSPTTKNKHPFYNQPFVASYGQFAVDPTYQKTGLGTKLINFVEDLAKRDGAKEIAIDTAEGAKELINYYKKRGYNFVTFTQWEVTNYRSVIMSKKL